MNDHQANQYKCRLKRAMASTLFLAVHKARLETFAKTHLPQPVDVTWQGMSQSESNAFSDSHMIESFDINQ